MISDIHCYSNLCMFEVETCLDPLDHSQLLWVQSDNDFWSTVMLCVYVSLPVSISQVSELVFYYSCMHGPIQSGGRLTRVKPIPFIGTSNTVQHARARRSCLKLAALDGKQLWVQTDKKVVLRPTFSIYGGDWLESIWHCLLPPWLHWSSRVYVGGVTASLCDQCKGCLHRHPAQWHCHWVPFQPEHVLAYLDSSAWDTSQHASQAIPFQWL